MDVLVALGRLGLLHLVWVRPRGARGGLRWVDWPLDIRAGRAQLPVPGG